jgi:hypothetical protein
VLLDVEFYERDIKPLMVTVSQCWLEHQHFETAILGGCDLAAVLADK